MGCVCMCFMLTSTLFNNKKINAQVVKHIY